ncbi:8-oxo-dGTP pyrophosphatase MutT (NUDIX family) [Luteibacter jiangsuensis]|uniref:8-oxo-dGTP pyrophosphatase MutT (NUDIX family) n=1 Tax=Luteibacter jiangsuensis TaxID=637577 RepID=A0ABT9SYG9_9GAMM|nr:8-oxo-dGTP pyrophosphatase MutT (NUDIX family) [Luteibacter jiangsuensis]
MDDMLERLRGALLPLEAPPGPRGWNHDDMAELIGDAPRRPAAVLIGIRDDREQNVLLTVRTDTLQQHAGQVAFPGGRVEPDDAGVVAAALRESREEIGLDAAMVTPLGFLESFETISGYSVTPVVARVAANAELKPDPGEVAEVFEVPFAFFLEPANLRRYTMEFRGHRRDMVEFLHAGYRIWGVTAAILFNLLKRMGHPC